MKKNILSILSLALLLGVGISELSASTPPASGTGENSASAAVVTEEQAKQKVEALKKLLDQSNIVPVNETLENKIARLNKSRKFRVELKEAKNVLSTVSDKKMQDQTAQAHQELEQRVASHTAKFQDRAAIRDDQSRVFEAAAASIKESHKEMQERIKRGEVLTEEKLHNSMLQLQRKKEDIAGKIMEQHDKREALNDLMAEIQAEIILTNKKAENLQSQNNIVMDLLVRREVELKSMKMAVGKLDLPSPDAN
ncbi:MAG: hypothetical protein Q8S21_04570 [Candidatus Paracaedibacteraceae bacterium]|nr:hypothetical protein [Candidatus Paracaedibacteraceae bacterium]